MEIATNQPSSKKIILTAVIVSVILSIIVGGSLGALGGFLSVKYINPETKNSTTVSTTTNVVEEESAVIDTVEKTSPAVVSIVGSQDVPVFEQYMQDPTGMNDPFFMMPQYRQKGTEKQDVSAGTGILVTTDGYIVTNRHVVDGDGVEYTVFLSNGDKYTAKILAKDTYSDLAVLKIDGDNFTALELGDSNILKPGQTVVAIGYALGEFKNTVSKGVISGLGRSIEAGDASGQSTEKLTNLIQTDAAINSGNSGGPLLNISGQVIGINVAMAGNSENIGFAIPINDARNVIESVKTNGKITRPYLGVRYQPVTKVLKEKNQLSVDYGVLVARGQDATDLAVMPGSPADKAGIKENDIILEVDGSKITEDYDLRDYIAKKQPGDKVVLKVLSGGEEKTIEVTLEEAKI